MFVWNCNIMKVRILFALLFFLKSHSSAAEVIPRHYTATRIHTAINIDGKADEPAWQEGILTGDFTQLDPVEGAAVTQRTEFRLVYDNTSVYLTAHMFDTHPDSILRELGNRDEGSSLNSDAFRFGLDPYNKRQSGYVFEVSASGVQSDEFDSDISFDAVWESAVSIDSTGWIVEMRIPFSAIRFPASDNQVWGVQFARVIRRNREYAQWTLTPKNVMNRMIYWGEMNGLNNIEPPLRLSLTPYLSLYSERAPRTTEAGFNGYDNSWSYSGGADIKYGIDERFTLDMTLLPDFSQVQSDNKVKNLSAFETIYEEKRPFFKEGIQLFSKGNIFYSRRIGKIPSLYYAVADSLKEGEVLEKNPAATRLLNATKLSGRTDKGLGIGIFNAVSGNTYASIRQPGGQRRKILTEPLSNYNVIVLDQQLKNNSNIFIINTNVMREGKARDANVSCD